GISARSDEMRRMHRRALMLAISFGLLGLGGLPHEGGAAPRFLPEDPPPQFGDPDGPDNGPYLRMWLGGPFMPISIEPRIQMPSENRRPHLVHLTRPRKVQN